MRGSFFAWRGAAAVHVGRSLTRRNLYTSDILQLKQEMVLSTSDLLQMGRGCKFQYRTRRATISRRWHVGVSIFSFQVVLLTSGILPPHSPSRLLRPGLSNQLIRAEKAAAKRTYFYQKSCLLPHFFAAFGSFWDFLFKTATERWLSPQNYCAFRSRAFFYN